MIATIALLRIVPYALVAIIAWQKGFKRLTSAATWLVMTALFVYVKHPNANVRGLFGAVFACLLLFHVLDLKPRKGR